MATLVDWIEDAPDWSLASCVDISSVSADQLFFDGGAKGVKLAKDFCVTCPLVATCLAYGQKTHSTGVWGGEELVEGHILTNGRRPPGRPPNAFCGVSGKGPHAMTPENTYEKVTPAGELKRECVTCMKFRQARQNERRRQARLSATVGS
jgi:hypothetical protein